MKIFSDKKKSIFIEKIIVVGFFVIIGLIYLHNLTRDVFSGDIGDLVTAAFVGGVAHPPGYPLFTLLGFILSHLPIPLPVVSRVGLISVFSSLAGLIIYYKFSRNVTKNIFLSLLSTSILAFSYLYWLHAELPEVFGLNNLFVLAILFFATRFYSEKKLGDLYKLGFLSALSLTHHHTILLIFPAVGLLVLRRAKIFFKIGTLVKLSLFTLIGFLPYLYVPISAATSPIINWDNVVNLNNFIRLLLRQDYGGFAPSVFNGVPTIVKAIVANNFLKTISFLYSYQAVFVAVLGVITLFKRDKWLLFSLLTAFLLAGPLFIFYSASVITTTTAWGVNERFYILASVVFVLLLPYGFVYLKQFIDKKVSNKFFTFILLSYFLIIPFFQFKANFPRVDLSKTQIGNNLARDLLQLPKNSVLFVSGDTTTFNLWYVHYVLGLRPDIDIINPGGVGGNSFLDREINSYFIENPKTKLNDVVHETIEQLRKKRKIFATYDLNIKISNAVFIPRGLVYELIDDDKIPEKEEYLIDIENQWKKLHLVRREKLESSEQNLVTPEIPLIYSNGLIRIGDYLISKYSDPAKAEHYYRRAMWIDPENPGAHAGLGLSLFKAYGDCRESINQMKEAINLYQIWKRYYLQLYVLYDECGKSESEKRELIDLYQNRFRENLQEQVEKQLTG